MPYDFRLSAVIPASAQQIYDAWLDSLGHSEITGSMATMSVKVGAEVSAWGGYINGRNLDLVPGERIVQSWRTSQFTDDHGDSIITVTLEAVSGGTLLTLMHTNVPDGQTSYERGGWQDHYFKPMTDYFSRRESTGQAKKAKAAAPKTKRKPTVVKVKTKRKTVKVKKAAAKKTPKRAAAAKAKPKRTLPKRAKPKLAKRAKTKPKRRKT
jgi:uncharacterized protein YndB with AHSA1/START domain